MAAVAGQGDVSEVIDCTTVDVDYDDDPTLSREERLARMDKAFIESLNRFEFCQAAKSTTNPGGNEATGGQGQGSSTTNDGSNQLSGESTADFTMSGTQTPADTGNSGSVAGMESSQQAPCGKDCGTEQLDDQHNNSQRNGKGGGKPPADIPSAANDDILAAQIRHAAENEPDPEKRARLWQEYRKYKGLPAGQ